MFEIANSAHFVDADKARELLEKLRWPDGPVCPHCGEINNAFLMEPNESKKGTHARKGTWKCKGCREQFSVTVGSIFEDSHVPLNKWLLAIHLLCSSKKGMSAHQLHRMLRVAYRTAWFMAHRIRFAMSQPSFKNMLKGVVEADETYVGGKRKNRRNDTMGGRGRPGTESHKQPVFAVVKRGGEVRSFHVYRVTAENVGNLLKEHVDRSAHLCTDEFSIYDSVGQRYAAHQRVNHSKGEYVRGYAHTNTIEGYFGLLKRGLNGVYHQVGKQHLHRYLSEFDFRYNNRTISDEERTLLAIKGAEGKRLQLTDSKPATGLSA